VSDLAARLLEVRGAVERAALRAGRDPRSVQLLAVSKAQPVQRIRAAYAAGQREFGESYAQELKAKAAELADLEALRWQFVGHLQSNKAKLVAPIVASVHTVDSEALGRELVKRAPAGRMRALIEVNIGGESQKGGVAPEGTLELARALLAVPGLELTGLMCVPPAAEPARPAFARLRQLRDSVAAALGHPLPELSMGMSGDFEEAIQEGATIVRVGTAIFGSRD
jgi:pyridoxal phosphate enzyme (YggS family)